MTVEGMGAALGAAWRQVAEGVEPLLWRRPSSSVTVQDHGEGDWWVSSRSGWVCRDPERAVAVAHLLVAAERIAAGAEVAEDRSPRYVAARHDPLHGRMVTLADRSVTSPACARRDALDLLRAADEAEAQS